MSLSSHSPSQRTYSPSKRILLPWNQSLLKSGADYLKSLDRQLPHALVLVPTMQGARRLRRVLAGEQGLLTPSIQTPSQWLTHPKEASKSAVLLAWQQVLKEVNVIDFPHLFGALEQPVLEESFILRFASQCFSLQKDLREVDCLFQDVVHFSPEKARWEELACLEKQVCKRLDTWGMSLVVEPDIGNFSHIIVLGIRDLTQRAIRCLDAQRQRGKEVVVLFASPFSDAQKGFDAWGRPLVETWKNAIIEIESFEQKVHLSQTPEETADCLVETLSKHLKKSKALRLGLCEKNHANSIAQRLSQYGWKLFDPQGTPIHATGILDSLMLFAQLVSSRPTWKSLRHLLALPYSQGFLGKEGEPKLWIEELDKLDERCFPLLIADAQLLASERQREIITTLFAPFVHLKKTRDFEAFFSLWLGGMEKGWADLLAMELSVCLELLSHVSFDIEESFGFFRLALSSLHLTEYPLERHLDMEGWMEMALGSEEPLFLVGLQEGCVPEKIPEEAWLPDSLRKDLGMAYSESRYARDCSLFAYLLASNSVEIFLTRRGLDDAQFLPSRLLLAQRGKALAQRVLHLFDTPQELPASNQAWKRDWILTLPKVDNPYSKEGLKPISPSALKLYFYCPMRFFLEKVMGNQTFEADKIEMNPMDFGNLCHAVLERFGRDESLKKSRDGQTLFEGLSTLLDQEVASRYAKNPSLEFTIQVHSARQRLKAFAFQQAAMLCDGWEILAVEQVVGARGIPWSWANHPISMIIDRIDWHRATGRYRVWDYKTSEQAKHPQDAHLAPWREEEKKPLCGELVQPASRSRLLRGWKDVQLLLYARFVQEHYALSLPPEVGYIQLPGDADCVRFCLWETLDTALMDSALSWCTQAISMIEEGQFTPSLARPLTGEDAYGLLAPEGLFKAFGYE